MFFAVLNFVNYFEASVINEAPRNKLRGIIGIKTGGTVDDHRRVVSTASHNILF